jgi:hypothetical protein
MASGGVLQAERLTVVVVRRKLPRSGPADDGAQGLLGGLFAAESSSSSKKRLLGALWLARSSSTRFDVGGEGT